MKSTVISSVAAALLAASVGTAFGQSVTRPGQIAGASAAVLGSSGIQAVPHIVVNSEKPIASLEERHDRSVNRIWVSSMLAMAAATTLDATSSWGKREGNPLLASSDGTFGAKGLSIKAGIAVGVIIPELLLRKHKDLKSKFAIGNFAEAAVFGGVAVHNMGIPRPR